MAWSPGRAGHVLMILVDTNVLSAMMRVAADPAVEHWFDAQPPESVWTTTITIFEIRFGLALLKPGAGATGSTMPSIVPSTRSSVAAYCRSTGARQRLLPQLLPDNGKLDGRSRSVTSRSPASLPREKQPSPRATPITLKALA